ncbi:MAG: hypothetical protein SF053_03990 [Bacteroidia bacterium]|nr:hypothetical protein [Bacteroidia bacterium]
MRRYLVTYGVFGGIALLYAFTRSPHPGWGDGIGFVYYGQLGFDFSTNATSHFLCHNINALMIKLLPGIDPVQILGWMSVGWALLALVELYQILRLACDTSSALLTVVCIALGFTWWRQAVSIEVYACWAWWTLRALRPMFQDVQAGTGRRTAEAGFWLGISLWVHIQNILLIPAFGWYLLTRRDRSWLQQTGAAALLLGIGALLWLPPWLWRLHTAAAVLVDNQFQTQALGLNLASVGQGVLLGIGYLVYNLHLLLVPVVIGMVRLWQAHRPRLILMLLAGLPMAGFAARYPVTDAYVFYLLPYLMLALPAATGLQQGLLMLTPGLRRAVRICLPLSFPLGYLLAWQLALHLPAARAFHTQKAYKGGLAYYLWPPMHQSPDPLVLTRSILTGAHPPVPDFERYDMARQYLQLRDSLDNLPSTID